MSNGIYLDHAATSPMLPEVIDAITNAMQENYGNASSMHQFGRRARQALDQAREIFAASIQATFNEIVLTSGGTEGDNYAILETAFSRQAVGRHLITTEVEHHAVLHTMEHLETLGFEVTYLPVDENGAISINDLKAALREDTILVSIMYGNNEVGTLMPIHEIGAIVQATNAYFHTDAVQAYGYEEIDVKRDHIDLLSVTAHKINGPKGIGFLYINENIHLPNMMYGGEQEMKRRPGTEAIPNVIGFATAVEYMKQTNQAKNRDYPALFDALLQELNQAQVDYSLNGQNVPHLPHILNIWIKGVPVEQMLMNLDLAGVAASSGSACTAGNLEPSHVLTAMYGKDNPRIHESLRFSIGFGTTEADMKQAGQAIAAIVTRLKK
ncbi:cysteine desulfurase family protein [Isobaculum melis]|uniref:cysteine desulfurase n=1 Tax=Isobaculum melis TaxID=142588 RepID=A0A1H9S274_9LACT|nr:cysteine desulfurase family protein [Isobaculum melis]SER79101.1 cysteine desulfurase [Isobaculum melis]